MAEIQLILGSSSPRRQEMLHALGLDFEVLVPDTDETRLELEVPADFVRRVAVEKAEDVAVQLAERSGRFAIIAGDTSVVLGDVVLGKPTDQADAQAMLRSLSGHTHQVMSGLCLLIAEKGAVVSMRSETVVTDVTFRSLSDSEISDYVAGGEPMDKAGAYAIQGGAAAMIRGIKGSHSSVIGLPMAELSDMMRAEALL